MTREEALWILDNDKESDASINEMVEAIDVARKSLEAWIKIEKNTRRTRTH